MLGWRTMLRINAGIQKQSRLCVFSYNSRGFGNTKSNLCNLLVSENIAGNKIPILCNQENFILKGNSYKISNSIPGFNFIINPAVKENQDKGRPKNGMFIAFPDFIKNSVKDVSPGNWRIQAVIVKCSNSNLLVINSYFPVDKRTNNINPELSETIQFIKQIIENNDFSNLLLLGDINCDFLRRNGHIRVVQNCIEEFSLTKSWDNFDIDFTCIHETNGISHTSIIDHFMWNEGLNACISDCGVVHSIENQSDHSPIYCVVDCGQIESTFTEPTAGKPKPNWKKADQDQRQQFSDKLQYKLREV